MKLTGALGSSRYRESNRTYAQSCSNVQWRGNGNGSSGRLGLTLDDRFVTPFCAGLLAALSARSVPAFFALFFAGFAAVLVAVLVAGLFAALLDLAADFCLIAMASLSGGCGAAGFEFHFAIGH